MTHSPTATIVNARKTHRSGAAYERRDRVKSIPFFGFALAFVGVVLLVPFGYTIIRSFLSNGEPSFVGLDNYFAITQDPNLQRSFFNTIVWSIGSLLLPVILGLGIAVMTSAMKTGAVFRAIFVLPYALAGTVVAIVGNMLFTTEGSINQVINFFGGPESAPQWLLYWPLNVIAAILIGSWQATGVNVVLFMVGLQTIPRDTLEAAALDGADGWLRFKDIIVPQLKATLAVVIGLTITNALRAFDVIWVLTSGGPNRSSETFALSMYRQSFLLLDPAVGSALAVVLTIIVVACSWVYLRRQIGHES